jgi:hypothetical protein
MFLIWKVMFSATIPKEYLLHKAVPKLTIPQINIYKTHLSVPFFIYSLSGSIKLNNVFDKNTPNVGNTQP